MKHLKIFELEGENEESFVDTESTEALYLIVAKEIRKAT